MRIRNTLITIVLLVTVTVLLVAASAAGRANHGVAELTQTTVNLTPVADASIESAAPDTNFGSTETLAVYYGGQNEIARALIRFNLAAAVPSEAIIDSARLDLFLEYGDGADPVNLVAALLTEDWVESEVTWSTRPATGEPVVAALVDTSPGYKGLDVTHIVRVWHNVPHYGLELSGPEGEPGYSRIFESCEYGENPPQMVVTYHLPPAQPYTFTGHVYQGSPPDTGTPVGGVTVGFWGDEDEWPEAGFERVLLSSTTTNHSGVFSLSWEPGDVYYPYLHIVEVDPPGTYSTGAQVEPPGYVKNFNVVSYLDIPPGTYGGIAFWDELPEGLPDLVITDLWNEDSFICYQIRNIGDAVAAGGHYTALFVDGDYGVSDWVDADLEPGERWRGCFDYEWECTALEDSILAWAGYEDGVAENDETNNRREEIWKCDITPPEIISGPTVLEVTQNSAVIFWETDEDCDSVVKYGKTARLYAFEETDSTLVREHSITLTSLEPSTTYNFVVQSTDPSANAGVSQDMTFETLRLTDNIDPTVSILDPGVCRGTVTISANASDDQEVEKVEFYLDNELLFTDYSPPYESILDTTKYENRNYLLKAKVHDLSGRSSTDSRWVLMSNAGDEADPSVKIIQPTQNQKVSGKVLVKASVSDDKALGDVVFYVDGVKMGFEDLSPHTNKTVEFSWDTSQLTGGHQLKVVAWDLEGKVGLDTVDVIVDNPAPPPQPNLIIKKQEVTRSQNSFTINVEVENQGAADATKVYIRHWSQSFQPISDSIKVPISAKYEADFVVSDMCGVCQITDNTDIPKGKSHTYSFSAMPVLVYPNAPKPLIGNLVRVWYEGKDGTKHFLERKIPVLFTKANKPIKTAYNDAIKEADYLIMTNPYQLFSHSYSADVKNLLSDMARLAKLKNGALGYLYTSDKNKIRKLIIPGGAWAQQLTPSFAKGKDISGYVLIVGETEVVPSWDVPGFNRKWPDGSVTDVVHHADQLYSDFNGDGVPDLIVGRIIGNTAADLRTAIQTSIGVHQGWPGYGFDCSHALVLSGTDEDDQNLEDDFVALVKAVKKELSSASKGFTVDVIHWSDKKYVTNQDCFAAFQNSAPNKDVIFFSGHGGEWGWDPGLAHWDLPNISFGDANPFVYAASCLTGDYECKNMLDEGIAEAFFDRGAAAYIGSTELAAKWQSASKYLFSEWKTSDTIGSAHAKVEKDGILLYPIGDDGRVWWRFWATEYNIYGDPKLRKVSSSSSSQQAAVTSTETEEPPSSLDVVVPDYEVNTIDKVDYVEIPGGMILSEDGKPQVPCYSVIIDYPSGYKVQDVAITDKSGMVTDTGLNIPVTTIKAVDSLTGASRSSSNEGEGWFPEDDYHWESIENPDGTTTLVIVMYPFCYNPLTTDVKFYKNYSFDISCTVSPVAITSLSTDNDEYQQGDTVMVDIGLNNSGEPHDMIVNASVGGYGSGEIVDGLLLSTLDGLSGEASFSPQWDNSGFEPGYYYVEVTLQDTSGNVLDRQTEMFRLGISSGEITSFTATPAYFDIGDSINMSLVFSNTGTVNITGTAGIRVQGEGGETVQEFRYDVTDLAPDNAISFDDAWDTSGADKGTYSILGYVLYDSMSTDPMTAVVSTSRPEARIYLPIVFRSYP